MRSGPNKKGTTEIGNLLKRTLIRPETAIFALYAAITCLLTYPSITLCSKIYGEPRDPLGSLWGMWWLRYSYYKNIPASPMSLISVPWGLKTSSYGTDPLFGLLTRGLLVITSETVAYNVILLFSFFLSAVAMYFLVRHLTRSRAAAAFSGLAFGFCPFMLAQGKEHLSLACAFWLPLFALLLVKAWRSRSTWSMTSCGALLVIVTLYNYQYGMLTVLFGVTFLFVTWLTGKPWRRRSLNWGLLLKTTAVVLVVVAVALVTISALKGSPSGKNKPLVALYQYSARPWDYLIPTAESAVFGGLTDGFITSHLHGGFLVENSLFLGYTTMALAIFALLATFARRGRRARFEAHGEATAADADSGVQGPDSWRIVLSFALCAAVAFIFSMPPTAKVLGIRLYFPSYVVFKVLPQFRAYARFGIIVMMCLAVLAGFGLSRLEKRGYLGKRAWAAVVALMVLVLLEFTIAPPFYSLDTRATTDYYRWLKGRPGRSPVAIYPLFISDDFSHYGYLFQQRIHGKSMLNGAGIGSEAERYRQVILDVRHPATPGLLKNLGAKYAMVIPSLFLVQVPHTNYTFPTEIDQASVAPGLKLVKRFDDCMVFEVNAPPAEFVPLFGKGSYQPYLDPEGRFWHPGINEVVVDITSKLKQPARCGVKLEIMSARSLARVTFEVNGKTLAQHEVPPWPTDVVLTDVVLAPGANRLVIKSDGRTANLTDVSYYSSVSAAMMISNILVEKKQ